MIPKTETTFDPEGKRNRLQDLLLAHQALKLRKKPVNLKESTFLALDTGEELLKLKDDSYGDFLEHVKQTGLTKTVAQDYIKVFKKFNAYREVVSILGSSKLRCLMRLKDDDIKILIEGGAVSGLTLANIAGMSCKKVISVFAKHHKQPILVIWHKRVTLFIKHIKLAFSAFAGGTK